MKIKHFVWVVVLHLFLFTKFAAAEGNDVLNLTTTTELVLGTQKANLIGKLDFIRSKANATLLMTNEVKKLLVGNKNLKPMVASLTNITKTLETVTNMPNFRPVDVVDSSLAPCDKVDVLLASINGDLNRYSEAKATCEKSLRLMFPQVQTTKIGYIINFIHFNKTQKENLLADIAGLERFADIMELFIQDEQTALTEIAFLMYNLKIVKFTICKEMKTSTEAQTSTAEASETYPVTSTEAPPNPSDDHDTIFFQ